MKLKQGLLVLLGLVLLGGCATMPTGPTVMVLPGPGKPFEVFQADEFNCRQWAQQQIGGTSPSQTANQNLATGAVVGTAVGAGLGVAIGAATGNAGAGAAIGGATGLLGGMSMAGGPAYDSQWTLQRQYDMAYQQCHYAKGNQIPGIASNNSRRTYTPPPPPPPNYQQKSNAPQPGPYAPSSAPPQYDRGPAAPQPGPYPPSSE
jgi:hypothetical protein